MNSVTVICPESEASELYRPVYVDGIEQSQTMPTGKILYAVGVDAHRLVALYGLTLIPQEI